MSSTQWTPIGPQPTSTSFAFNPVSGRVTALAVDPTNPNVVYLGAAEGGVWKTTDGGTTWTPLTDNQPSLAVGSIAIDPSNPSTIYVGTGEENYNLDAYFGAGILKSTDGGSTWTQIAAPFAGPFGSDQSQGGAYIGSVAVNPTNSQVVLAGANFFDPASSGPCFPSITSGVYVSINGGQSWTASLSGAAANQIVIDPANGSIAYAAMCGFGVYKSTDGGFTWGADNGTGANVLNLANAWRIALAIDPKNPSTLYAGVSAAPATSDLGGFIGLFKTTDGGVNWMQLPSSAFPYTSGYCSPGSRGQCDYDNVVAVNPASSATFVGGSAEGTPPGTAAIWESSDGGSTWSDIDEPPTTNGLQAIHPDVHAIAFAADGSKMYVGTDGGVWSTTNVTTSPVTWANLNATLALTQFYPGMSIAPYDTGSALGGTQDNGTQGYEGQPQWQSFLPCGDGGWTSLAGSGTPSTLYWSCVAGEGVWKYTFNPTSFASIQPPGSASDVSDFVPPLVSDPSNFQTLYFGTDKIYQSMDGGTSWNALVQLTSGGAYFTSIAVAPTNSDIVYAGASDGTVAATFNASAGTGATWIDVSANNGLPARWVTQVAADPKEPLTVYATFSGFSGFTDTLGHVFESPDGSTGWTDISGNLPNIPVNDIVVDPDIPNTLYVATDIGVFMTSNPGPAAAWAPINNGLPNVAILSLKMNEASRVLRAGTHGRSAWDLLVPGNLPVASFSTPTVSFVQALGTTSAAQTVTLTNNGNSPLTVAAVSVTGANAADFAQSNNCPPTLAAGADCAITLTFATSSRGILTANLQVADNAPASPQLVYLSGQGISPLVSLSAASLTFSNQTVGTASAAQILTLTDTGQDPLAVLNIGASGDFAETNNCGATITSGGSCTISVTFTPTAGGSRAGALVITDDAANSPQTAPLSGNGTDFSLSSSPTTFAVNPGQTATYTLSVTPVGGFNSAVALTCSGVPLASTCAISPASVTPNGTTAQTATVTVTTTAPSNPCGTARLLWPTGGNQDLPKLGLWLALLSLAMFASLVLARRKRAALIFGGTLLLVLLWAACGGGVRPSACEAPIILGTPPGTYTLTLTGASGSLTHSTTVTLTVN